MQAVKTFFSTIWKYWKKFGQAIGDFVGRIFLMLFYLTLALPFGIGAALFSDGLDIRRKNATPQWRERTSPPATLESSTNQF